MSEVLLYDLPLSGNCLKVCFFLNILDVPFRAEVMDVLKRKNEADWFKALNPLMQISVITDGDVVVQDSQAILVYLALKHDPHWLGETPQETAAVMEWLSYAAKEVSNGPQMSRLWYLTGEDIDIARATEEGNRVLRHLDKTLATRDWLALGRPTIADIAVFPYVALAREGKLQLDDCLHVLAWVDRIVALEGYVPMKGLPGYVPGDNEYVLTLENEQ